MLVKIIRYIFITLLILLCGNFSFAQEVKNIVVLATGGTIAGTGKTSNNAKYSPAKLMVSEMIGKLTSLNNDVNIIPIQFSQIASQNMNNKIWINLAKNVNKILQDDKIHGIVITHGTDTLEETAYFLHLVINTKKPIILVGSMRPSTSLSADGELNLFNAIKVASNENSIGKGVLVVFNDYIYSARGVTKANTTNVNAFIDNNFGPLGQVYYGDVKFYRNILRTHTYDSVFNIENINNLEKIDIIYGYTNQEVEYIDYLISNNFRGIIFSGVGNGNLYDVALEKISNLSKKEKIFVARSTRVGSGIVIPNTEVNDEEYKFITSDNLSPQKSRILLMISLTKFDNYKDIRNIFSTY